MLLRTNGYVIFFFLVCVKRITKPFFNVKEKRVFNENNHEGITTKMLSICALFTVKKTTH